MPVSIDEESIMHDEARSILEALNWRYASIELNEENELRFAPRPATSIALHCLCLENWYQRRASSMFSLLVWATLAISVQRVGAVEDLWNLAR